LQQAKDSQEKLQKKLKDAEAEVHNKDSEIGEIRQVVREKEDFSKSYQEIKIKLAEHQIFTKEVNDFKRHHPQSLFV
jgi:peptidoglycan hydrolase CwlO-like protein